MLIAAALPESCIGSADLDVADSVTASILESSLDLLFVATATGSPISPLRPLPSRRRFGCTVLVGDEVVEEPAEEAV
ncbi:MAG: hypothetical protein AAFR76_09705 [Planctomycetota bacterium]